MGAKTPTRQSGSRHQKLRVLKERVQRLAWIQRLGTSAAPADKGTSKAWRRALPASIRVTNKLCFPCKGLELSFEAGGMLYVQNGKVPVRGSGHDPVWGQEMMNHIGRIRDKWMEGFWREVS